MTLRSFAGQLAVRLSVVVAIAAIAGASSYGATQWEPRIGNAEMPPAAASR